MPKAQKATQMIHYGKFWKSSWCNFMLPDAAGEEIIIIEMYYAEAICISNYASYQTCRSGSLSWIQTRLKKKAWIRVSNELGSESCFLGSEIQSSSNNQIMLHATPADLAILFYNRIRTRKRSGSRSIDIYFWDPDPNVFKRQNGSETLLYCMRYLSV